MSMNVEQKIKIYKPSIEHLDLINIYEYKEVKNRINRTNGACIIHMTPKLDTYLSDDEDNLIGHCDSMMCEIKIFDTDNRTYYKRESLFDSIIIENIHVESRIYKDLSTMYIFSEPVDIVYGSRTLYVESDYASSI